MMFSLALAFKSSKDNIVIVLCLCLMQGHHDFF